MWMSVFKFADETAATDIREPDVDFTVGEVRPGRKSNRQIIACETAPESRPFIGFAFDQYGYGPADKAR